MLAIASDEVLLTDEALASFQALLQSVLTLAAEANGVLEMDAALADRAANRLLSLQFSGNQLVFGLTTNTATDQIVFKDDVNINNTVVGGEIMLNQSVTVSGTLRISGSGYTTYWNQNAAITATDIQGSNGVIHVIDTVILPPEG